MSHSDDVVHLVRNGRYPHVITRDGGQRVLQSQVLAEVTCGLCLGAAGGFLEAGDEHPWPELVHVELLLGQVERDRKKSLYWQDRQAARGDLDIVKAYLESLRDHLTSRVPA